MIIKRRVISHFSKNEYSYYARRGDKAIDFKEMVALIKKLVWRNYNIKNRETLITKFCKIVLEWMHLTREINRQLLVNGVD